MQHKISFTVDELALIYEGVKHMGFHRDILEKEFYISDITNNILDKISEKNIDVTSPWYVSDNIIED